MSVTIIQVETIIAQALDDLEAERIDVPAALRLVATIAWDQGLLAAERSPAELPWSLRDNRVEAGAGRRVAVTPAW